MGFQLDDHLIDRMYHKTWRLLDMIEHKSVRRENIVKSYVVGPIDEDWYMEVNETDFLKTFRKVHSPQMSEKIAELERIFEL